MVQTIGRHGLDTVMGALIGNDPGAEGALRAGGVGALFANVVNNLPAYVAGEAVIAADHHTQLLALLVGPLATPWASLATLIWYERRRGGGAAGPLRGHQRRARRPGHHGRRRRPAGGSVSRVSAPGGTAGGRRTPARWRRRAPR